jgi:hypothetical protein
VPAVQGRAVLVLAQDRRQSVVVDQLGLLDWLGALDLLQSAEHPLEGPILAALSLEAALQVPVRARAQAV